MAPQASDDDDGTQRLESTRPGIMLHELTHRVLNTQGVIDTITDGDGNPGKNVTFASCNQKHIRLSTCEDGFASEFYGIIDAVRLAESPEDGNAVSRGRLNADSYNLFAISELNSVNFDTSVDKTLPALIDQAKDFDWSGQGGGESGVASLPREGE